MCPACFESAAMIVGSVISTGGVSALIAKSIATRGRSRVDPADELRAPQEFQHSQTKSTESKGE